MEWIRKLLGSGKPRRPEDRRLSRNDACWCGSGRKYKSCHLEADQRADAAKASSCTRYG
jgi:hypothetical protein